MENNKMIVKKIMINNKEQFIDLLLRELILRGISYVQIDNEIHFDQYIIRFYDSKKDLKEIVEICFKKIEIQEPCSFIDYLSNKSNFIEPIEPIFDTKEQTYRKLTKKLIKSQNKQISKLIRTKKK